uniref:Methyltransferase n=1 Tax=viral metagenome TaxID=1070528 RepID=A0A6C0DRG6_9ZZZZ
MDYIANKYTLLSSAPSDINEHLPTLYRYAKECDTIFETGVRGVVSSWAFLYGLLQSNHSGSTKKIILNDIDVCNIDEYLNACNGLPITVQWIWKNNLEIELNHDVDLTFIDTWHIYGQLKRELDKFSKITKKYIIMHDTTVDEIYGETIRCGSNAEEQSIASGFPIDEINKGLGPAISDFLENNKDWVLHEKYTNNNGLTILKRI